MTSNGQVTITDAATVKGPVVGVNTGTIIYQQVAALPGEREVLAMAHQRLHELPVTTIPDIAPLPPGSHVPFSHNPLFVGRDADIRALAHAFGADDDASMVNRVLAGITGAGKTQLAIEFAHRYGQYFAGGVAWLNCSDPQRMHAEIATCGAAMQPTLHDSYDKLSLDQQVRLVLAAWKSELPRLLIFDQCEDEHQLAEWLPPTGGCRVLVTSRVQQWPATLKVDLHSVRRFARPDSIALLHAYRSDVAIDDPALDALAMELGDLPLALHIVGSFLAYHRGAAFAMPAAYLAYLRSAGTPDPPSESAASPSSVAQSITRTFALCYQQLDAQNPLDVDAQRLLARAICFAPDETIPRDLLLGTLNLAPTDLAAQVRASDAFVRLTELGLVEMEADGAIRLHRLVAGTLRTLVQDPTAIESVAATLLVRAETLVQQGDHQSLLRLQPHLRALVTTTSLSNGTRAQAFDILATHLQAIGDYAAAMRTAEQALQIRAEQATADDPLIGVSLQQIGSALQAQGRYMEARSAFERALNVRERLLGPDAVEVAETVHALGVVLHDLGDYAAAQPVLERAFQIREAVLGIDHADTATTQHELGRLRQAVGDLRGAALFYKRALATRERVHASDVDIAASLTDLGHLAFEQAEYAEAQTNFERALAIRERIWGPTHPDVAVSLNNLGSVYRAMGEFDAANTAYERALAIREQVLGPLHPDTAQILNNLGVLMRVQERYTDARRAYERALAIQVQTLGADHPDTATTLNNLGMVCRFDKDYRQAQAYLERALTIRERRLGPEHLDTAAVLNNLGNLMRLQHDYQAAQRYLERALTIRERQLDEAHPDRAATLTNLGYLYQDQHDLERARTYLEQALEIREQVPGADPMKLVDSLVNLAELTTEQGNLPAASAYYKRALAIIERRRGAAAPQAQRLRTALAAIEGQQPHQPAL